MAAHKLIKNQVKSWAERTILSINKFTGKRTIITEELVQRDSLKAYDSSNYITCCVKIARLSLNCSKTKEPVQISLKKKLEGEQKEAALNKYTHHSKIREELSCNSCTSAILQGTVEDEAGCTLTPCRIYLEPIL
jgi:hypothetical protein